MVTGVYSFSVSNGIEKEKTIMDHEIQKLHDQVNQAIIRCRRVYSVWAKKNKVSYNRMLVLYTIREYGSCTQKQVCDSYMLPRQTVNHVITEMRKEGILAVSEEMSRGKEKALVLTAPAFFKSYGGAGGGSARSRADPDDDGAVHGV